MSHFFNLLRFCYAKDAFAFHMFTQFVFLGPRVVSLTMPSVCSGDWVCSLCRDVVQPEVEYDCESARTPGEHTTATYGLAACDQRVSFQCRLILILKPLSVCFCLLCCHAEAAKQLFSS